MTPKQQSSFATTVAVLGQYS